MEVVVIIIAAIVLIGGGLLIAYYMEKKRREDLEQAAAELGLEFKPEGDLMLQNRLGRYKLFTTGRGRKMTNLIEGITDEVQIAIFDYQYTTGSGKHKHTARQTIATLESPSLVIPNFTMRPESMFDKIGSALGFQDIDFDSHPTFSKMFVLKGDNEEEIRNFFTPEILEYFESMKGISVESNMGGSLIFYRPNKRRPSNELKDVLEQAYVIFGLMADRPIKK